MADTPSNQPLEPSAVIAPFANIIGLPLQGFNSHMSVKVQPVYNLMPTMQPVFDLSLVLKQGQYVNNSITVTPTDTSTSYNLVTPPNIDVTYNAIEVSITNVHPVQLILLPPSLTSSIGIFFDDTASRTTYIVNRTVLPFFVPANWTLQLFINGTSHTDGTITLSYVRIERPVGMGPFNF